MVRTPDRWARLPFAQPPCTLPFSSHPPTYLLLQVTLDPPPGAFPLRTLKTTVMNSVLQERLRRPYGEARDAEQRRLVKGRIRDVAAQQGSVETSIAHHPDLKSSFGEQDFGE